MDGPIVAPPSSPIVTPICPISRNPSVNDMSERFIMFDTDATPSIKCDRDEVVSLVKKGIKTLIVHNLPRDITVEKLRIVFEKYGPVKDVYIPKNMDMSNPLYGTNKGFAIIKFLNADHSASAFINEYGRLVIGSNIITVEFAKSDKI